MDTTRRDLLVAGAALTALMPAAAGAQPANAKSGTMEVIHVWAGPDGVSHAKRVTVKGLDPEGLERVYTATELLARAFCHEIDHIDGLLFVDRLTPLKRDLLKRKLRKKAKADDWEE